VNKGYKKHIDFLNWVSPNGKLKVVGVVEGVKKKDGKIIYKVECCDCSPDIELFPLGYFISTQSDLKSGKVPCGCSSRCNWDSEQSLILAKRGAMDSNFIMQGYSEEFHGQNTRVYCECLIDGHKWTPIIASVIHGKSGCTVCKTRDNVKRRTISNEVAFERCKEACLLKGYEPIGFIGGKYTTAKTSKFEYRCLKHGIQSSIYDNFVNTKRGCKKCAVDALRDTCGTGNGWYPKRAKEKDYLYVFNFNDEYLKVGRSFDVEERKDGLKYVSLCANIIKVYVFTALHEEIYPTEQLIHSELRQKGFEHMESTWSTETFTNNCIDYLIELLEVSELERIF
jgi:hypothetical protein